MHQARQAITMINKLQSRKLLSRNKQRHHSKALLKNVSPIRYFMQHSSNSYLRLVKYTCSLYNEYPKPTQTVFKQSPKGEARAWKSLPVIFSWMMRPYKHSFSSPEEWPGILSSRSFLLPLSLTPILISNTFFRKGRRWWEGEEFFSHFHLRTYRLIWEQERVCRDGNLLQNLVFTTVFDLFMTTSHPHLYVLVMPFSLSLSMYQSLPKHQKFVLERKTLFSCSFYFALWWSLFHLFSTQQMFLPPPEHPGRPSLHTFFFENTGDEDCMLFWWALTTTWCNRILLPLGNRL